MINVETELNKYKTCKDRDELARQIKKYKDLTLQYASNLVLAGNYNKMVLKLQEMHDKLPAPNLKPSAGSSPSAPKKTAAITSEEKARINEDWQKVTKK